LTNIPHFRFPFALAAQGAQVVEQDSEEEIVQCATIVLLYRTGDRIDLPNFGIDDPALTETVDADAIRDSLIAWEPRIEAEVSGNVITDLIQSVTTNIKPRTER